MKYRLLEIISCPNCNETFDLEVFTREHREVCPPISDQPRCRYWCFFHNKDVTQIDAKECVSCYQNEIISGLLTCCGCGNRYPIIQSVPRLLPATLLHEALVNYHQEFLEEYWDKMGEQDDLTKTVETKKLKTLRLFGYQWTTFVDNFGYYKEIFLGFVHPFLKEKDFENQLVLEVGCGSGRPASVAASFGAEVVGVDLSEAVQTAQSLTEHYPLLHVVQGDVYALPFRPRFDFVYSVGVLQHIPDPQKALASIAGVVTPGQSLVLWVYGVRELWYQPIIWIRKITTRLPFGILRVISITLAALSELFLLIPHRILSRIPFTKKLAGKIPGRIYTRFPFRENVVGWFDRLGAPVTYYFSKIDVETMLDKAGFDDVQIIARPDASASWVVKAKRSLA